MRQLRTKLLILTMLGLIFVYIHFLRTTTQEEPVIDQQGPIIHTEAQNQPLLEETENKCFQSVDVCLQFITSQMGHHPKLLSYTTRQHLYSRHPASRQQLMAPNLVHYIRFHGERYAFNFPTYVSFKSVHKFIKPDLILVWGDALPSNDSTWWIRTVKEVANLYFVKTNRIQTIGGKKVKYIQHESDWLRLIIMKGKDGI